MNQIKAKAAGWGWANNAENLGKIESMLADMENGVNDFGRRYMLEELGTLKKEMKQDRLIQELEKVLQMSTLIDNIKKCMQSLLRMHKGKIEV